MSPDVLNDRGSEEPIEIDDPELLAELERSAAEMDRDEGSSWEEVRERVFGRH
jgi:hypothetical protein